MNSINHYKLREILAGSKFAPFESLLWLQGVKAGPDGQDQDLTISAVFSNTREIEISFEEIDKAHTYNLTHSKIEDVVWFPSPRLQSLLDAEIEARRLCADVDGPALRAKADAVRQKYEEDIRAAKEERANLQFRLVCDNALAKALQALSLLDMTNTEWHLVLRAMGRRRDSVKLREGEETRFFEERVACAWEHGASLFNSEKRTTWQTDILRRSEVSLQASLDG